MTKAFFAVFSVVVLLACLTGLTFGANYELPSTLPAFPSPVLSTKGIVFAKYSDSFREDTKGEAGGRLTVIQVATESFAMAISFSGEFESKERPFRPEFSALRNGWTGQEIEGKVETSWDEFNYCYSVRLSQVSYPMISIVLPDFTGIVEMQVEAEIDGEPVQEEPFVVSFITAFWARFDERTMALPLAERGYRVIGMSKGEYPTVKVFVEGGVPPYRLVGISVQGIGIHPSHFTFKGPMFWPLSSEDRQLVLKEEVILGSGENGEPLVEVVVNDEWLAKYTKIIVRFQIWDSRRGYEPSFRGGEKPGIMLVPQGADVSQSVLPPLPSSSPPPGSSRRDRDEDDDAVRIECPWSGGNKITLVAGQSIKLKAVGGDPRYHWQCSDARSSNHGIKVWKKRIWRVTGGKNFKYFTLILKDTKTEWMTLPAEVYVQVSVTDDVDKRKSDRASVRIYLLLAPGDVDGSEEVTSDDATLAQKFLAGEARLSPTQQKAGDVNGDGELDAGDVALIEAYAAGEIITFPVEGIKAAPKKTAISSRNKLVSTWGKIKRKGY